MISMTTTCELCRALLLLCMLLSLLLLLFLLFVLSLLSLLLLLLDPWHQAGCCAPPPAYQAACFWESCWSALAGGGLVPGRSKARVRW